MREHELDIHDWHPIPPSALAPILRGLPCPWWIAGGHAIDLFLGRTTRPHADTDVCILRRDQLTVQQYLRGFCLHKTKQPTPTKLAPWPEGEYLGADTDINDIWVKREPGGPWVFQLMLIDTHDGDWVYRRDHRITGPIADLGWTTSDHLPFLRPEIQLLYKGGSSERRPKDDADFDSALPRLDHNQRHWLADALATQCNNKHPWLNALRAPAD